MMGKGGTEWPLSLHAQRESLSSRVIAHLSPAPARLTRLPLQKLREDALAASPKPKPFPRAQHTAPPSPPLSRRTPPSSRPGTATLSGHSPAGGAGVAARGGSQGRSSTTRACSYGQRSATGQGGGQPDFEGFLARQEKFVQVPAGSFTSVQGLQGQSRLAASGCPGRDVKPASRSPPAPLPACSLLHPAEAGREAGVRALCHTGAARHHVAGLAPPAGAPTAACQWRSWCCRGARGAGRPACPPCQRRHRFQVGWRAAAGAWPEQLRRRRHLRAGRCWRQPGAASQPAQHLAARSGQAGP